MKRYNDVVRHLVQDYTRRYGTRPFNVRLAKATADEWCGVDLDEQPVEVLTEGLRLRMQFDNSMPKGEVEVV